MRLPSPFSILKLGVGPSSSHTLGPCLAALDFRRMLQESGLPAGRLQVRLMGSLALTGKGHLTDLAVTAGLAGFDPETEDRDTVRSVYREVAREGRVAIGAHLFPFHPDRDILFDTAAKDLPHPNTMTVSLLDASGAPVVETTYRSVGGGRVLGGGFPEPTDGAGDKLSMDAIVALCLHDGIDLPTFALRGLCDGGVSEPEAFDRLHALWTAMGDAIDRGLSTEGLLPGPLMLERRAGELYHDCQAGIRHYGLLSRDLTLPALYAMAVAEENASGGRVVTAPTCGSAGVVPAVLTMLKERFRLPERKLHEALLAASVVGGVVVENASIAGAEVGCQGEVGVASAMAAAAAVHCLDGSVPQAEAAAETALEHHLGLTCDPVAGLVQIPCIERNAVGAVTALNAANLALLGSGKHAISFDAAVKAMKQVGADMSCKYKETAQGGLAALVPERGVRR